MADEYQEQALSSMHDEAKALLIRADSALLMAKDDECILVMARAEWRDEILKIIEGTQQ